MNMPHVWVKKAKIQKRERQHSLYLFMAQHSAGLKFISAWAKDRSGSIQSWPAEDEDCGGKVPRSCFRFGFRKGFQDWLFH